MTITPSPLPVTDAAARARVLDAVRFDLRGADPRHRPAA